MLCGLSHKSQQQPLHCFGESVHEVHIPREKYTYQGYNKTRKISETSSLHKHNFHIFNKDTTAKTRLPSPAGLFIISDDGVVVHQDTHHEDHDGYNPHEVAEKPRARFHTPPVPLLHFKHANPTRGEG